MLHNGQPIVHNGFSVAEQQTERPFFSVLPDKPLFSPAAASPACIPLAFYKPDGVYISNIMFVF